MPAATGDPLDGHDAPRDLVEHRGGVPEPVPTSSTRRSLEREQLAHRGDDERLRDRLTLADRQSGVVVGDGGGPAGRTPRGARGSIAESTRSSVMPRRRSWRSTIRRRRRPHLRCRRIAYAAEGTAYAGAATPKWASTAGARSMVRPGRAPSSPPASTGTSESSASSEPCDPPPRWWLPPASSNSQPAAAETTTSPAFGHASAAAGAEQSGWSRIAGSPRAACGRPGRTEPEPSRRATTAPSSRNRTTSADGSPSSRSASVRGLGALDPADQVPRPIRREHERLRRVAEAIPEPRDLVHLRLAVVRDDEDRVAGEKLVEPARRCARGPDGLVAPGEHVRGGVRPRGMRGVVVVREVEQQEVEPVACHEPIGRRPPGTRPPFRRRGCGTTGRRSCARSGRGCRRRTARRDGAEERDGRAGGVRPR